MVQRIKWVFLLIMMGLLCGCATDSANIPCPNFGEHCIKTPINGLPIRQSDNDI